MAAMNTADIGFEKEIWKAADKMRGNIDASEYKSVVLGLIFLKYISDNVPGILPMISIVSYLPARFTKTIPNMSLLWKKGSRISPERSF